jgi:hypothetical protein
MGGSESPRSGKLAQILDFVKDMTSRRRTALQQVVGAVVILVPAFVVIVLSAGVPLAVAVAVSEIDPRAWRWILGTLSFGLLCGSGIAVRRARKRRREDGSASAQSLLPEPGQQVIREESRAEGDKPPDEDDDPTRGGSIGA